MSASGAFRGEQGKIAFDVWAGTSMEIAVANPDGTGSTFLSNTPNANDQTPRWSPDGSRIVYMRRLQPFANPPLPPDIWVMDADGSNQTQLTNTPLGEFVPAWTPDGRIVFCGASGDTGGPEIYVMNADGSERTRLTNSPGLDCWPAPAPSGNRLSFTSMRGGVAQIFTMKLDGSNVQQVTTGSDHSWASDWSPSGNDIVFIRENFNDEADTDVWMTHTDGTGLQRLTDNGRDRYEAFPSWSPDGSQVVFGGIVSSGVYNVFSTDPLTGDERTLVADDPSHDFWSVAYPSWQPLGRTAGANVNLALGAAVRASKEYAGSRASLAVDGDWYTYWNSGDYAPQWIEVDLGSVRSVGEVDLGITQLPDCETVHRVLGRASTAQPYALLREFAGYTVDQQILRYVTTVPKPLRFIRVETTSSCSWVAWREIEVYAPSG